MRKLFIFSILFISCTKLFAQKDSVEKLVAFKITAYIQALNDSTTLVQVDKSKFSQVPIKEKQMGVLYHCYKTGVGVDTASIGFGRCQLIKGDYYYFAIHLKKGQQASEGDLLYLKTKIAYVYDGLLLGLRNQAIEFTDVYGENFMNANDAFINTKDKEQFLLDLMVKDIQFTGKAMLEQMPAQNEDIKDGIYKGKKVFDAMQAVKPAEIISFIKYVLARPGNYAGNKWKISETFATWMVSGTPTVIEN